MAADEPTVAAGAASGGAASTTTVGDTAAEGAGTDEGTKDDAGAAGTARDGETFDLRGIVRQFTAPMIESLDARLREQVEAHADALLDEKVHAAVSDRLATIERAIADLSRTLDGLERRLATLEHADSPLDLE
jgi:hypothetical protein